MIESAGVMSDIQQIRQRILERYQRDPKIRINVSIAQPKLHLSNVPVEITDIYAHIFQIEETSSGQAKRHMLQCTDVLTHNIEILDGLAMSDHSRLTASVMLRYT